MLALHTSISFAALAFFMALSPGPNLLYLASRSVCQGALAGLASLAGVCTAMLCYVVATAFGLSALIAAVPVAYEMVRFAGAAYLLWLAASTLRTPSVPPDITPLLSEPCSLLFRRGFTICLLNPKIVLMYGSLLPQFVRPEIGNQFMQTIALGFIQVAAAALAHTCIVLSASRISGLLRHFPQLAQGQRFLLSGLLAGVAFGVAFDKPRMV